MSHDQGRPSLFAGMEDGATPGSDTQRVRILSTLESTRRPQRPARKGPKPAKAPASAQTRAWTVTLGLGVVTLLVSFVLIVQGQRPQAKPPALSPAQAKTAELTATMATAQPAPAASTEQDASVSAADTLEALPPTSASSSSIPSRDPMAALATPTPDVSASAAVAPSSKASQVVAAKPKAGKPGKSARNDHDVALIEAVMNRGASSPSKR